jgi:hypothetical protein
MANLLTSYYATHEAFKQTLNLLGQQQVLTIQTMVSTNGGVFSNASFETIHLDLTRGLKLLYQVHRSHALLLASLRHEITVIGQILSGSSKAPSVPPPPPPTPQAMQLESILTMNPFNFRSIPSTPGSQNATINTDGQATQNSSITPLSTQVDRSNAANFPPLPQVARPPTPLSPVADPSNADPLSLSEFSLFDQMDTDESLNRYSKDDTL